MAVINKTKCFCLFPLQKVDQTACRTVMCVVF